MTVPLCTPCGNHGAMTCPNCGGAMAYPARAGYAQCAECAYVPAHGAD